MKFLMYIVKFSAFVNCGSLKNNNIIFNHYITISNFVMFKTFFYAAYFGEESLSSGHQPYTSQVLLERLSLLTQRPLMMPEGKHNNTLEIQQHRQRDFHFLSFSPFPLTTIFPFLQSVSD